MDLLVLFVTGENKVTASHWSSLGFDKPEFFFDQLDAIETLYPVLSKLGNLSKNKLLKIGRCYCKYVREVPHSYSELSYIVM